MECIELVGLPYNIDGEELENAVVKTFQVAGINIGRRNFHAVHRLADQCAVIPMACIQCQNLLYKISL